MTQNCIIQIEFEEKTWFKQLLSEIAEANGSEIDIDDRSSGPALGFPPEFAELVITGKAIALAVIPVIAFYLGKGRRAKIRTPEGNFDFKGYKAEEVAEIMRVFVKGQISEETKTR
jgi:hypothetical protein